MNSTRLILDKPGVNSSHTCWDLCRHQNRDDAPPSEPSCLAAEFNSFTNTCRFAGSKPVYRPVNGLNTVLFQYDCTHAFTPTEKFKFWRFNNRLPNATNSKGFSLNVSSLPDCYDEFVNSRTYRSRWGGFGFNHNTKKCTLYSHLSTSELKVDAGSELYVDSNDGSGQGCSDAFPETSPGKADSQGVLQNGSFPRRYDCFKLCRNDGFLHFEKCFGFDYNDYDKSCHFSTNSNYSLTSRANTTHYRRARRCFNGAFNSFISTRDTSLTGGYKIWVPSYIPWSCAWACLGWNVAITLPPCYGFSFNHTDQTCTLYQKFDHALGVVGASPGVDQFRRILYSNYSCNETYIKTSNASSQGGIEQPKDINTFARCASRCIDYAIATDHTCHGFDLNTTTDLCTIYLEADFKLWPSDHVDNYRRNKTCELPYY